MKGEGDRDEPRGDDQEREEHLGDRGDQGRVARRVHVLSGHGALDHQEVRAPVAEREHEAQAHRHPQPLDAHGIAARGAQALPSVGKAIRHARDQPVPASDVLEAQHDQRGEAEDDQEELEHLVVDAGGEAAQDGVGEHHQRGYQDARMDRPAEKQLEHQGHGVHVDARGEHRHGRERDGVETARLLVEAQLEVFGHAAGLGTVVEGHHEDAHEDHGRDGADPVEVVGQQTVLGPVRGHPHDLERPEIRRQEGEARDPAGDPAPRAEEVVGVLHATLERKADPEDEDGIDDKNRVIDPGRMHQGSLSGRKIF
ncbi:hypothetical protein D3C86_1179540 [compost metagenome]